MLAAATATRTAAGALTLEVGRTLFPVNASHWRRLFTGHVDPPELIDLVGRSGMDGFQFYSIVIGQNGNPLLVIPVMQARYPVATTLDGYPRTVADRVASWLPDVAQPKVLVVGFVEGEWGQVGLAPDLSGDLLDSAWRMAFDALQSLSFKLGAQAILFWQFTQESLDQIPAYLLRSYTVLAGQPFATVAVSFASVDAYIASLKDRDMARYLKRALRDGTQIKVERITDPKYWIEDIYRLYQGHVDDSQLSFGKQSRKYFEHICTDVPGSQYVLYFSDSNLIGFELVIADKQQLVSKYFAMKADEGRAAKLYFLSWLENIRYCIAAGLPVFYAGAAGEGLKAKLGARFEPTAVVLRVHNPVLNALVRKTSGILTYQPQVPIGSVLLPR